MRATLLLCDGAQALDGKLYVLGWGWSYTGPNPTPLGLAIKIDLDHTELGRPHHMEVFLEDDQGQLVVVQGADGVAQPLEVANDFEIPQLPDLVEGIPVVVPAAINFPPLPLEPGRRYTWRLVIDGQSDESWHASFLTRPAATS